MKYVVLTGGLKNVGDFLITKRIIELIKNTKPGCEIVEHSRYESLSSILEEVNSSNAIILAGGPGYLPNMYPKVFKLVENLDDIKVPIYAIGMGWYGAPGDDQGVYQYIYTDETKKLLKRIQQDAGRLGCRDFLTARTLKNNGLDKTVLTGCPAWYDLEFINETKIAQNVDLGLKSIAFSTPAAKLFTNQSIEIMTLIKNKFPNSKLYCAFHRGIGEDSFTSKKEYTENMKMKNHAEKLGYEILDLSFDVENMKIYDSTDLHIGYRVHAHIYCLSHRRPTILIDEDGRGRGVNQALGLYSLDAYKRVVNFEMNFIKNSLNMNNKLVKLLNISKINPYLIKNLSNYLDESIVNDFVQYESVFSNMNKYYKNMKDMITKIP